MSQRSRQQKLLPFAIHVMAEQVPVLKKPHCCKYHPVSYQQHTAQDVIQNPHGSSLISLCHQEFEQFPEQHLVLFVHQQNTASLPHHLITKPPTAPGPPGSPATELMPAPPPPPGHR